MILAAYYEYTSSSGLNRIFGISRNTVAAWLKKPANCRHLPPLWPPGEKSLQYIKMNIYNLTVPTRLH